MRQIVYKVFGLDKIYDAKYGAAFFVDALIVWVVAYVAGSMIFQGEIMAGAYPVLVVVVWLAVVMYFLRETVQAIYVWRRQKSRKYIEIPLTELQTQFFSSAAFLNYNTDKMRDSSVHIIGETDTWRLYDVVFSFYRKLKSGGYKSKKVFYTIFEIKLQRQVTHAVFDSKSARRRQFKPYYLDSQRVSMDVNFDDYFDTYVPQYYHVDALSFLSPEVLDALVQLRDYDFEFVHDRLFCYAPLLPEGQLDTFRDKCLWLHGKVNDNLDTYRDDRLIGEERRHKVTEFGSRLLASPMKYAPMMVLSGAGILGAVIAALYLRSPYILAHQLSMLAVFTFIVSTTKFIKVILTNRRMEREYIAAYHHAALPENKKSEDS